MPLDNILNKYRTKSTNSGSGSSLDSILDKYRTKPQPKQQEEGGIIDGILDSGKSFLRGFLTPAAMTAKGLDAAARAIGEYTGTESGGFFGNVSDTLTNWAESLGNGEESNKYSGQGFTDKITNFDWWTDKNGARSEIPEAIGNAAFFLLPTARVNAFTAPGRIAGTLSNKAAQAGAPNLAKLLGSNTLKDFANSGATFAATMAPFGAFVNSASIVDSLREQGLSDIEIAKQMGSLMWDELPADVAFSILTGGVMKGAAGRGITNILPNRISNPTARNILGNLGAAALETTGNKYSNEYQMRLANMYSGKPYGTWDNPTPEEIDAGTMGILGGLVPSAIGVISNRNSQNEEPPKENTRTVQDIYQDTKAIFHNFDNYQSPDDYKGENGKAEGKYWVRQGGDVSFEGAQPQLLNAVDMLSKYYYDGTGKKLVITAGTNGESHAEGEHSHYNGWKVDVVDYGGSQVGADEDGPLTTKNFGKGYFADDFIKYGRSLGLGMNFEKEGTDKVHIDVALDGTQWDGNGEHAGGFNSPRSQNNSSQNFEETADDPNFSAKQNEIWREAQWVAAEAKKRYGYNIKPEWIYGQWTHEAGVNFDSENARYNNNFGGLTQAEFNGEENKQPDGGNYYRTFKTPREYSEAYLNDFLRYYDGMKNVTNADEFVDVLAGNDYFDSSSPEKISNYKNAVREFSGKTPQTRMKNPSAAPSMSSPIETSADETSSYSENEEESPTIDFSNIERETQKMLDEFVFNKSKTAEGEEQSFLSNLLNDENKFVLTEENLNALVEKYREELQTQGILTKLMTKEKTTQPAKTQTAQSKIETPEITNKISSKYLNNASLIEKIRLIGDWASENKNMDLAIKASEIENSGDAKAQEKFVRENPLPQEFIQKWGKENADATEETSTQEKSEKPKVEIPAETLELARAEVDLNNAARRAEQGQALIKIANLNKFKIDSDLKTTASKGYKKAVPKLKALLEKQGFLNDGKESDADKLLKLRRETAQKQKELDYLHRHTKAKREMYGENDEVLQSMRDFDKLHKEQQARQKELQELNKSEWTRRRNAPPPSRKMFADYQNEVDELKEETDKAQKKVSRLFHLDNVDAHKKAKEEYKNLQKQLDDKIAERDKFQLSPEHEQNLNEELEFASEKRRKEILKELEEIKQKREPKKLSPYQQAEKDLQDQIAETVRQKETAREQGLKLEGEERKRKAKEFRELESREKSLKKDLHKLQVSTNRLEDLQRELADINDFIGEDEKNTKRTKRRDAIQKEISALEEKLGINQPQVQEEIETPAQKTETQPQSSADQFADVSKKETSAPNSKFAQTQAQTNQILENIREEQAKRDAEKSETPPPTSKKTYHFDGTSDHFTQSEKMVTPEQEKPSESAEQSIQADKTITPEQETNNLETSEVENKESETKKALADLAQKSWNDKNYNGKVSFTPSKKFRDKVQELFGHDVNEVFITAADIRHIKNKHGEGEEKRGQIDIKPENISEIYDVVNNFDSATKERDDKQGNQNIMVVKSNNGKNYALLVERGKSKAQVKTFYKQKEQVLDVTSPKPNVRNDPAPFAETSQMPDAKSPSLNVQDDSAKVYNENIPQSEQSGKSKLEGVDGKTAKIRLGNKKYANAKYKIVEVEDLLASHNADGTKNEDYPQELQPRDRDTEAMIAQMQDIAHNPDIERFLDTTKNPNEGAPVVRADGIVLNGNGRVGGMQECYRLERLENRPQADEHRQELISRAEEFGIDSEQVKQIKNPLLVREVTDKLGDEDLTALNESKEGGAHMPPKQQARVDAKKIERKFFREYVPDLKEDLRAKENEEFVQDVLRAISTENEFPQYFNSKGLTADGEARVKRALLRFSFGSDELVANSSAVDVEGKNLQNALEKSAATFAKIKTDADAGRLHDYDISDIKDAAEIYLSLRRRGKKVSDYLKENKLGEQDSNETRELLKIFDKYTRSGKKLNDFVQGIADGIIRQGNPQENSMFGEREPQSFSEIIQQSAKNVEKSQGIDSFDATGEVEDTAITDDMLVADKDLTSQQKKFVEIGNEIGLPVKFFRAVPSFGGVLRRGTSYINAANAKFEKVFYHEMTHYLAKHNPKIFAEILKAGNITETQRQSMRDKSPLYEELSDRQLDEEILADNFMDFAKRAGLFREVGKQNKSLAQKLVGWLKSMFDKFASYFRNPEGGLTRTQQDAMYEQFKKMVRSMVDRDGNKIFRVSNFTGEIQLADGRPLPQVDWDNVPDKYSFAGRKAKTADKDRLTQAKKLERQGKNRDEIYQETGWFKGKDGKWRFEIPDNFDKIDFDKLWRNEETKYRLDEIYDNPALYEAYPKLRKVLVQSEELSNPDMYGYAQGNEITLNWNRIDDDREESGKTLVHEIQHIIQGYEKFSNGGYDRNVLSEMLRNQKLIRKEVATIPNGRKYFKSMLDADNATKLGDDEALQKAFEIMSETKKDLSPKSRQKVEEYFERFIELSDTIDEIRAAKGEILYSETDEGEKIEIPYDKYLKIEAYGRLGGEQEARAVGERLFDREGTPQSHDEDALIIFGGETYGYVKQSENKKTPIENGDGELVKDGAIRENSPHLPLPPTASLTAGRRNSASSFTDNKGGVRSSGNSVNTNSPRGSVTQSEGYGQDRYSIDPSNNSNEGWSRKIKNYISDWWEGERKNPRPRKEIKRLIEQVLPNYRIKFHHYVDDSPVLVDTFKKIITAKKDYDFENILRASSGIIAKDLHLPQTDEMKNYISDWIWTGAVNNDSAESRRFEQAMRENPVKYEHLYQLRKAIDDYQNLSVEERLDAIIHDEVKNPKSPKQKKDAAYAKIVDDLIGLKDELDAKVEEILGKKLNSDNSIYDLSRILKGKPAGIFYNLIQPNTQAEWENAKKVLKQGYQTVDFSKVPKSFNMIVNGVVEKGGTFDGLQKFCYMCLEKEMHEKNRTIEKNSSKYKTNFTEKECDDYINKYKNIYGEAQKEVVAFSNIVLDMECDAGLISAKKRDAMKKSWKNFIPTDRIMDDDEEITYADSMKHKKGSTKDVVSPLQTMLRRTARFITQAEINKVKLKAAQHSRCGGFGKWVVESDYRNGNEPATSFWHNGKKQYLLTTKTVADALNSLTGDKTQSDMISAALNVSTSFMRANLTANSLDFSAGNPARDIQEAVLYSKQAGMTYSKMKPILNLLKIPYLFLRNLGGAALYHSGLAKKLGLKIARLQDDPKYLEWVGNGGSQATMVAQDMNKIGNYYDDLSKNWKKKIIGTPEESMLKRLALLLPRSAKQVFSKTLRAMQEFSELSENTTRFEVYKTAEAAFAAQRPDGKATQADTNRAVLASRDITIDFARAGSLTRKANRKIAFLNAGIQSLDKNYRLFKEVATSENKAKALGDLVFKLTLTSVLPALIQAAAVGASDDEDKKLYESSVNNWKKNSNWILPVGGNWFTIPKSYDLVARLVGTVSEQLFNPMFNNGAFDNRRYGNILWDALPSLAFSVIQPLWEVRSGYSTFYGGPIVPQKEMNLDPEERYGKNTSPVAKELAKYEPMKFLGLMLKGKYEKISPREIDHLISGYFGMNGKVLTGAYGSDVTEFPISKRFIFNPEKNPQVIQDYYDIRSKQREHFNTYQARRKEGNNEKPEGYDEKLYKRIKASEDVMKKIALKEKKLLEDEKLPKSEVEKQLHALIMKQVEIAEKALGRR